jgi:hypothetical protein
MNFVSYGLCCDQTTIVDSVDSVHAVEREKSAVVATKVTVSSATTVGKPASMQASANTIE